MIGIDNVVIDIVLGYAYNVYVIYIYDNKYEIWAAIHYCVSLQSAISHRLLIRKKKRATMTKIHPFDL